MGYFLAHGCQQSYPGCVLFLIILVILYFQFQMVLMLMNKHKNSVKNIIFMQRDKIILEKVRGHRVLGRVGLNSYVGAYFIILVFKNTGKIRSYLVTRESVGGEFAYRKLAALLLGHVCRSGSSC